jgi:hypothetical protein
MTTQFMKVFTIHWAGELRLTSDAFRADIFGAVLTVFVVPLLYR